MEAEVVVEGQLQGLELELELGPEPEQVREKALVGEI